MNTSLNIISLKATQHSSHFDRNKRKARTSAFKRKIRRNYFNHAFRKEARNKNRGEICRKLCVFPLIKRSFSFNRDLLSKRMNFDGSKFSHQYSRTAITRLINFNDSTNLSDN